jgi:hypothetical protein
LARKLRVRIPRTAIYPPLVAAAFVLSQFGVSFAPVEALLRPLIVAVLFGLALHLSLSVLLRSTDRGAFVALIGLFVLMDLTVVALVLLAWLTVAVLIAVRRRRGLAIMPWLRATPILNGVAVMFLIVASVTATVQGAFVPPLHPDRPPRGAAEPGSPDIYLIMLDGYPRADTLTTGFGFDNRPFLDEMAGLGFATATNSHSNYDVTVLSLASVFNGQQIPTLVPNPPAGVPDQFRVLTRLINQGRELDAVRTAGYEIVTIPSGYYEAAVFSSDRLLDSGELTTFETQLLSTSGIAQVIGGLERSWLPEQHRARIFSAFEMLGSLAAERSATPKFVFAHLLAPHMPIAFDRLGAAPEPLPCFPTTCSMFYYGDAYADSLIAPMRDQIAWLNGAVLDTVRTIQSRSATPPVIVIFSDHGMRNRPADHDEMFRSLFLASTPGKQAIFPDDVTPVNIIPRLLNAYTGSQAPLASEESYWVDTRTASDVGIFPRQIQIIAKP